MKGRPMWNQRCPACDAPMAQVDCTATWHCNGCGSEVLRVERRSGVYDHKRGILYADAETLVWEAQWDDGARIEYDSQMTALSRWRPIA